MSERVQENATDQRPQSRVLRHAPQALRPYLLLARLDRPIGTWLLLWPCWWSLALVAPLGGSRWPDPVLILLFGLGAVLMRGAGCTLNDIADRDYDGRVARTALRPLPSGRVSVAQALAFMVGLCLAAFLILLSFNGFAIGLGAASLGLVAIYPFMKRITYWPQFFLGLAFNYGALLGWAAVAGGLGGAPLALYLGGIAWTLGYDTIYAHQDKEDDALVGLKSSALRLGAATRPWLFAFYGLAALGFAVAGALAGLGWGFYALGLAALGHLLWQAAAIDIDHPADCLAKFKSNRDFGLLLFAAVVAGQVTG